jgi:hypothetical protein
MASGEQTTPEDAVWAALAALHGVPTPEWWQTFRRVLAEHGYVVAPESPNTVNVREWLEAHDAR